MDSTETIIEMIDETFTLPLSSVDFDSVTITVGGDKYTSIQRQEFEEIVVNN